MKGRYAVGDIGEFDRQNGHAKSFVVIGGVFPSQSEEIVEVDFQTVIIVMKILLDHVDGKPVGVIQGHDLTFGWDPAAIRLVLGAAYVGSMDDLAVWNRALTAEEIARLHALPGGVETLRR